MLLLTTGLCRCGRGQWAAILHVSGRVSCRFVSLGVCFIDFMLCDTSAPSMTKAQPSLLTGLAGKRTVCGSVCVTAPTAEQWPTSLCLDLGPGLHPQRCTREYALCCASQLAMAAGCVCARCCSERGAKMIVNICQMIFRNKTSSTRQSCLARRKKSNL